MDDIKINSGSLKLKKEDPSTKGEDVKQISAKLHDEYDRDLKEIIGRIPKRERSALYRKAVRSFLGLSS